MRSYWTGEGPQSSDGVFVRRGHGDTHPQKRRNVKMGAEGGVLCPQAQNR